jgi:ubiquinone/menaquinone biosynthesis C-methylase UbiE
MNEAKTSHGWSAVDHNANPDDFVDYLETLTALGAIQLYKQQSYRLLRLPVNASVLDVGCGTGDDVLALAKLVGSGGRVVGIDNSAAMIAEAHGKQADTGVMAEFAVGSVYQLDFPDNTFDGVRADRVFQHLADREAALAELIRVTKPGGRILLFDPDWETLVVDAPNPPVTRKILNACADRIANPWAGRQQARLLHAAGLGELVINSITLVLNDWDLLNRFSSLDETVEALQNKGDLSREEAADWLASVRSANVGGYFFSALTGFTAVGTKPA